MPVTIRSIIFILIVFVLTSCGKNPVDPVTLIYTIEKTKVEVHTRDLYVNDEKFVVRGVGYAPTPIGYGVGSYDYFKDSSVYTRDIPLLRQMGCNTIRTWAKVTSTAFLDSCYNNGDSPIYVIMGFSYDPNSAISNSTYRQTKISEFKSYVNTYKDHRAVLLWCIGNDDNNGFSILDSERTKLYQFINDMAKAAHEAEGRDFHPTTTALADNGSLADGDIGNLNRAADDASMIYLDIWGLNLYPQPYPADFTASFSSFAGKSAKPLLITEFGIDAYNNGVGPDESTQATNMVRLWHSIKANPSGVCVGGSIMAYSDEWWKAGNSSSHDTGGGGPRSDQPDNFSNEEWYGIMAVSKNSSGPDTVTPRPVYYRLQTAWR
ncbi:MAG: glycoside hydrolase family 2 TIM barrel-domain containing protein [bacterium]|nr:glycoside hydrolase family 2 TIM barrel-domain containing protein [bacterium]